MELPENGINHMHLFHHTHIRITAIKESSETPSKIDILIVGVGLASLTTAAKRRCRLTSKHQSPTNVARSHHSPPITTIIIATALQRSMR
jgi:hypothetical protein